MQSSSYRGHCGTPFQGASSKLRGCAGSRLQRCSLVDDAKLDEILWMQIDEFGKQTGASSTFPWAPASPISRNYLRRRLLYVIGSQSDPKDGEQNAIARFKFDAASQTIKETEVIPNLRDFLVTKSRIERGRCKAGRKAGSISKDSLGSKTQPAAARITIAAS